MPGPLSRAVRGASVLALLAALALGQEDRNVLQEEWRWTRFTVDDGLPSDSVYDVVENQDGTWALTAEGLALFDGWRWELVEGVPRGPLSSISVDERGTIWVLLHEGVFRGDARGFDRVELPEPYGARIVGGLAHRGGGALLLTTWNADGETWEVAAMDAGEELKPFPAPSRSGDRFVPNLYQTGNGAIWLMQRNAVYRLEDDDWTRHLNLATPSARFTDLDENAAGDGIAGLDLPPELRGVWVWSEGVEPHRVATEKSGIVATCAVGPEGAAAVYYRSGAMSVRSRGKWQPVWPPPDALRYVKKMRYRQNGDLWACTERGLFLHRRSLPRWTVLRHMPINDRRNHVNEVLRASDGRLWLGTSGGVEVRDEAGTLVPFEPTPGEALRVVTGLAEDEAGRVWVSGPSFAGLLCWDGSAWTEVVHDAGGAPLGTIHKIRGGRGSLWLAGLDRSDDGPLGSVDKLTDGRAIPFEPFAELADEEERGVLDVLETEDGAIWLATSLGVARHRDGAWSTWTPAEGLPGRTVLRLAPAADGGVWVANEHALSRIAADGTVHASDFAERTNSRLVDAAVDGTGRLWVTTLKSLHFLEDDRWVTLGPETGLDNLGLWPILPAEDRLYVGSMGGGTYVLDLAEASEPGPRIEMLDARVDGGHALVRWRASTHWNRIPPELVETQWRLNGEDWSAWTTEREVQLSSLKPGEHRFEVRAKSLFGTMSEESATATLHVPLPLGRNPAFQVPIAGLSLALVLLGITYVHRSRRDAEILRRNEAEQRRLLDEASDPVLICSLDERVVHYTNLRAAELFGHPREELIRMRLDDLLDGLDAELLAELESERHIVRELSARRAGGGPVPVEASARRLPDGRVQAILRDLTERRRLEEERRTFEREITERQKLESLGQLAGGVAHDFNNLLMIISGSADQALRDAPIESRSRQALERVMSAVQRAGELTQQLLAYSGRGSIQTEPIDLNGLVLDMGTLLESSVRKGARIVFQLDPLLPAVEADAGRLQQVVLNLIVNASDAIGDGEGRILVRTSVVRTDEDPQREGWSEAPPAGRWVALDVADDGEGMDAETRGRIFDPFFTTKFSGRGLGLAAVRGIVQTHAGYLRVTSEPGGGATFTVLLPPSERPAAAAQELHASPWRGSGTVLVVDDESGVREVATSMLESLGFDVVAAAGGREAVGIHRERRDEIVCALLDLTMPGMNGLETMAAILAEEPDAKVILMSGFTDLPTDGLATDRPQAFLHKPFSTEELQMLLRDVLGRTEELEEAR